MYQLPEMCIDIKNQYCKDLQDPYWINQDSDPLAGPVILQPERLRLHLGDNRRQIAILPVMFPPQHMYGHPEPRGRDDIPVRHPAESYPATDGWSASNTLRWSRHAGQCLPLSQGQCTFQENCTLTRKSNPRVHHSQEIIGTRGWSTYQTPDHR